MKSESDSGTEWKRDKGKTLQFLYAPRSFSLFTLIVSELHLCGSREGGGETVALIWKIKKLYYSSAIRVGATEIR